MDNMTTSEGLPFLDNGKLETCSILARSAATMSDVHRNILHAFVLTTCHKAANSASKAPNAEMKARRYISPMSLPLPVLTLKTMLRGLNSCSPWWRTCGDHHKTPRMLFRVSYIVCYHDVRNSVLLHASGEKL